MDAIMDGPDDPDEDPDYLKRFAARHEFTLAVLERDGPRFDALVYPSVQVPPPTLAGRADWTTLTLPDQHADRLPDLAPGDHRPGRLHVRGRPVGLELVGRPYAEATLFGLAYAFEQATHHRRAPVTASSPA